MRSFEPAGGMFGGEYAVHMHGLGYAFEFL
jgi:hypothetical protein